MPFFASQTHVVHQRFKAVFASLGRPTSDVICTYGMFTGAQDIEHSILAVASASSATVDEVNISDYWDNGDCYQRDEPAQRYIYDRMTTGQILDFMEVVVMYGRYATFPTQVQGVLAQFPQYANAKVVVYEGSPNILVPGSTTLPVPPGDLASTFYLRQNAIKRHPRMRAIMLRHLENYQSISIDLYNYYFLGSGKPDFCWDAYEAFGQQRGTGNSSTDAINITNPQALDQVTSEIGAAWHDWAAMVPASVVVVITNHRILPGRNGPIRGKGLRHGMYKLVR